MGPRRLRDDLPAEPRSAGSPASERVRTSTRSSARPVLESRNGPLLLWTFWSVVVVLSGVVALASFSVFLTSGRVGDQPLLQGPLAVNPAIDDQLVLLFSPGLVHGTQVVLHFVGFAFFAATAALLVARRPS